MAKLYSQLNDSIKDFIQQQHMFFTATAAGSGRINLSPKGLDCLRVLDDNTVAYLDLTGSGNETSAHILENQRLTIMFCSFSGAPLILRLYGWGEVILPGQDLWQQLRAEFADFPGIRQIIKLHIDSIQTSCGFGVPLYDFVGHRNLLPEWADKKGVQGIADYQQKNNLSSIDGIATHLALKQDD